MIEWRDTLSTGIFEVDQQHRELIRRFNTFATAVREGYKSEDVYDILLFMHAYAIFHFETEESIMREIGYPEMERHAAQHQEFTGKQFWLHQSLHFDDQGVAQEIVEYLEQWITTHVTVEDKKIGAHAALVHRPVP